MSCGIPEQFCLCTLYWSGQSCRVGTIAQTTSRDVPHVTVVRGFAPVRVRRDASRRLDERPPGARRLATAPGEPSAGRPLHARSRRVPWAEPGSGRRRPTIARRRPWGRSASQPRCPTVGRAPIPVHAGPSSCQRVGPDCAPGNRRVDDSQATPAPGSAPWCPTRSRRAPTACHPARPRRRPRPRWWRRQRPLRPALSPSRPSSYRR
jgi:hypothetical protein